ncbi:HAD family hydrolase [Elizabethkingia anophelis]|uniref:phosphonatase-like hydrolase n=1 Tax=Elizabethkingia anophelis TaxID=1117645 RepID=UPI0009952FBA|nr:phosphonatase-like hydrolase [Elizabethkingia anophelis]AQW94300.1 HAD family hydrolase [Elizabethkingia anophelis]MCT4296814.1 phosphonatase-like hydrolase [Elizabethkingia anophelis]MCT4299843.1 phosphonatase-like hydrolase [Elizabethkingia anophelis]MDV3853235.1 HAD family hydrolase [Elizabethkingia anophelis]MDV3860246.1 HAD family hydrolase [Elizabethkingia anophelis]
MEKKIKLVVFDMAGTTIDENNLVYKTVRKAVNEYGYNVSLEEVLQYGAGKEKQQAIKDVLENCTVEQNTEQQAEIIFTYFKKALEQAYDEVQVKPVKGVPELFTRLRSKGIKIALNTGYDSKTANKLLQQVGWENGRDVDAVITAEDVLNGRPHPDMIYKAMKDLTIDDSQFVLKAGDSEIDIEEGKNAGCGITIGVLSGAQTREQLQAANPDYILDSLAELDHIIPG